LLHPLLHLFGLLVIFSIEKEYAKDMSLYLDWNHQILIII